MKLFSILLLFCAFNVDGDAKSVPSVGRETIKFMKDIVKHDLVKEYGKDLANQLKTLGDFAKKIGPWLGPAGDILTFALFFAGGDDNNAKYFNQIKEEMNRMKEKLDVISDQITMLDNHVTTSTKEILVEAKFETFFNLLNNMEKEKANFKDIIENYSTNGTAVAYYLEDFIRNYKRENFEFLLVNFLDNGSDFSKTLIEKIIELYRLYETAHGNEISSTLSKTINDVYSVVLMAITKGFSTLDVATNMKIALTNISYPEDLDSLNSRKEHIYEMFYASFERTLKKLHDADNELLIDLKVNGDQNQVRLINVLQTFWANEDDLSGTCSRTCESYKNYEYNGGGCNGAVRDCQFSVSFQDS